MDFEKIKTIIRKEWAEIFKNKMIISSIIFMPLLMTAIPLVMLATFQNEGISESANSELPAQFAAICGSQLSGGACFQVYMVSSFMIMFMIVPLFIPVNIAAYSIVGEKTSRTLEPLLATPITTAELLIGKNLAAVIPAVLATWLGFGIFAAGAFIISRDPNVIGALINPMWLLAVILIGPLSAILSVNFSMIVSSRVNDPRVAEQISALVILPVVGIFMGQMFGLFLLTQSLILVAAVVIAIIDAFLVYLSIQLFERENILSRWK